MTKNIGYFSIFEVDCWDRILIHEEVRLNLSHTSTKVGGQFLALEFRKRLSPDTRPFLFNMIQVGLVTLTVLALGTIVFVVQQGLIGAPEMRIFGNNSSNLFLHWYQDRSGPVVPQG